MLQFLESKLYADVEGTCSGQFGYIIAVVSVLDIGRGIVLPSSGQAEFVTRVPSEQIAFSAAGAALAIVAARAMKGMSFLKAIGVLVERSVENC